MDEALSWAPSRAVFVRRSAVTACITFVALLALSGFTAYFFELPFIWILPTAALATIGFLIDDQLRWRNARFERWTIEDGHLRYDGVRGPAQVPLAEVVSARVRTGGHVVVQLAGGTSLELRFLPYPVHVAEVITARRQLAS